MKNCPNCSAPLEPYKCKCDYCGTYYYDLTAIDISGHKPTYVKFKTRDITGKECVLTALAMPSLDYVEVNNDIEAVDVGMEQHHILSRSSATISMNFELIESWNGKLCIMEILDESRQNND